MRINRFLAAAGLGSRRGVEQLVRDGRVRVNGRPISNLAVDVSEQDVVKVGSRVVRMERKMMAVLHKPKGFVCTASQTEDHRTIYDLLPKEWPRVFYVGRLDKDSEGLLLVTNDGDLAQRLAHPSHKVDKEYVVTLDKPLEQHDRLKLLRGFMIEPGRAKCEEAVFEPPCGARVVLRQGLKRQLRLMFYRLGYEVERLVRVRIGGLRLEDLPPGGWRVLSGKEIDEITNPPGGDNSFKPQGSNRPHERRVGVARRVGPRAASRAS